jgi:hypothetical protein
VLRQLRLAAGLLAIIAAFAWVASPSAVDAVGIDDEWCTTQGPGGGDGEEELCCGCVGDGQGGVIYCNAREPGRGGTYWCSDSYCPYEDEPCGLLD